MLIKVFQSFYLSIVHRKILEFGLISKWGLVTLYKLPGNEELEGDVVVLHYGQVRWLLSNQRILNYHG